MPRLTPITDRGAMPPEAHEPFDAIIGTRGTINAPASMLMYAPQVAMHMSKMSDALRKDGTLNDGQVELAVITAAREFDCNFVFGAHAPAASRAGISQETIDAVANDGDLSGLPEDDALIIRYGRELLTGGHRVSDETFNAARQRFGDRGVIELGALMGTYLAFACTLNATEMETRPDMPVLPSRNR